MLGLQFPHIEPLDDAVAETNKSLVLLVPIFLRIICLTRRAGNENDMSVLLIA